MTYLPPPPPSPPPGYHNEIRPWGPPANTGHGMAVAALVCGIVGCILALIPLLFVFGWCLGAVAVVLGFASWRRGKRAGVRHGRAGMVLGVLALVLGVVGAVVVNNAVNDLDKNLQDITTTSTP